jgi:hypothetical protein
MTESETPSLVFRKTSLTTRQRFTPARACSTLTRMRANLRFVRFSEGVRVPRGGFFFRLAGLLHCWLIPLESGVFVQHSPWWIRDAFLVGDLLVGRLADASATQEPDAFPWDIGDDHVLVAVHLLPATVMQGLFFGVFRPLATPLRAVDNEPRLRFARGLAVGKVTGVPLRTNAEIIKGGL